jgi:hypothetical protein
MRGLFFCQKGLLTGRVKEEEEEQSSIVRPLHPPNGKDEGDALRARCWSSSSLLIVGC